MASLFQRQYDFRIEKSKKEKGDFITPDKYLIIPNQLTLEFEIIRKNWSSAQEGKFKVYNLGVDTRESIFKDQWTKDIRVVQLRAGYVGQPLPLIFNGQLLSCQSYRSSGSVDVITDISAYDVGLSLAGCVSTFVAPAGTSDSDKIKKLASDLGYPAVVGNFPNKSSREEAFNGPTWKLLQQITKGKVFVDNGQILALGDDEVLDYEITLDSGTIIGSPRRSEALVDVDVLFDPRFSPGMTCKFINSTAPWLNGIWKVQGVTHKGIISPAVAGETLTTLTLWNAAGQWKQIKGARFPV